MKGHVDSELRALVPVGVSADSRKQVCHALVWVDTAFNGSFVIPQSMINDVGLQVESTAEAVLADGSCVEIESYGCSIHWDGKVYRTQVVANDGQYGLVGTMLLAGRKLVVDYRNGSVAID